MQKFLGTERGFLDKTGERTGIRPMVYDWVGFGEPPEKFLSSTNLRPGRAAHAEEIG